MVRHGKDKKRRAGRTGRTSLKNRNYRRWNPKPAFTDGLIKAHWDPSKSPAVNMRNMGLVSNPGQKYVEVDDSQPKEETVIQLYDIPDSDSLQKKTRPLSAHDQRYIAKCITKHGDDFTAMFRDIKVNNMQYTETQLRKMASRFLLLDKEQRDVQVLEDRKAPQMAC